MVIAIMRIAGVLWLIIGVCIIFADAPPLTFQHGVFGAVIMSCGVLFIGISGIIATLNKLALRAADSQTHRF